MRALARQISFVRHIPAARLLARARLTLIRRLHQRWRPKIARSSHRDLQPVNTPPSPLFAPRSGMIHRTTTDWTFRFLGRTQAMAVAIDWHSPSDQLWRMNLHYMEYLEELGAEDGIDLIGQWIAANPPFARGYWHDSWNGYALSIRAVAWMQWLARHGPLIAARPMREAIDSLAGQLLFLETNLEVDLGGNHLIKNIKALLWASAFFGGPIAMRWRARGLRLLDRELHRQILDDGMHAERSPSYHAQVLADLIEIRYALRSDPLDGRLDAAIEAMLQVAVDLAHPDGGPALFNDAGLTMAYSPAACAAAWQSVSGRAPPAPSPLFAYRTAGYFGLHDDAWTLIADMGAIGPDELPAHAHGDIGSFELSVGGRRMIVDQGVFEYVAGPKRAASRATANHNSLAIEGAEQADFFGAFRCGRRPRVDVLRWVANGTGFLLEGRHDGFRHLAGRPIAIRRFEAEPGRLHIVDRLVGDRRNAASIGLLLHPDCTVRCDGDGVIVARDGARLHIAATWPIAIEEAVWWPDMGIEIATRRLRLTLPSGFRDNVVVIQPFASNDMSTA